LKQEAGDMRPAAFVVALFTILVGVVGIFPPPS
jgi:hypothetical protein